MATEREAAAASERDEAYDQIDRFLRNNLSDADYAEYSDALDAVYGAPQAVRMLTDKDLYELWSQHWDGSDSVPYAFLAALGIVPLAPQDEGGKE